MVDIIEVERSLQFMMALSVLMDLSSLVINDVSVHPDGFVHPNGFIHPCDYWYFCTSLIIGDGYVNPVKHEELSTWHMVLPAQGKVPEISRSIVAFYFPRP